MHLLHHAMTDTVTTAKHTIQVNLMNWRSQVCREFQTEVIPILADTAFKYRITNHPQQIHHRTI